MKKWFEEKFIPIATKIANMRVLLALRDGIILAMPLMIIGSLFIIISDFPIQAYQDLMLRLFGEGWGDAFVWATVYPATMSIISLIACFGVAKSLAESYEVDGMPAGVLAISAYLLVNQFNADAWGWSADLFGTGYLFVALIVALAVGWVYQAIVRKNWVIKLPDSVPPSISGSFIALIPGFIIVIGALLVKLLFSFTAFGDLATFIGWAVSAPLTKVGTSLGGVTLTTLVEQILWSFGIHGSNIVSSVMEPVWVNATLENLAAYQAGTALPHVVTKSFVENFLWIGGSGATLPLVIWLVCFARSKVGRDIGRLSLAPGLFNINEPVVFGLPVVLNPFLMIPYIGAPVVIAIFSFLTMKAGIFPAPNGLTVPWTTPYFISGYLATGGKLGGLLLQVINFALAFFIWFPFIRAWDRNEAKKEIAEAE